jgi:hypothetical protein
MSSGYESCIEQRPCSPSLLDNVEVEYMDIECFGQIWSPSPQTPPLSEEGAKTNSASAEEEFLGVLSAGSVINCSEDNVASSSCDDGDVKLYPKPMIDESGLAECPGGTVRTDLEESQSLLQIESGDLQDGNESAIEQEQEEGFDDEGPTSGPPLPTSPSQATDGGDRVVPPSVVHNSIELLTEMPIDEDPYKYVQMLQKSVFRNVCF